MEIRKKEDKPMVIHTKEKTRLHMKSAPEAKIKGRNVLTVQRGPKTTGTGEGVVPVEKDKKAALKIKSASGKKAVIKAKGGERPSLEDVKGKEKKETGSKEAGSKRSTSGRKDTGKTSKAAAETRKTGMYTQYKAVKQEQGKGNEKKSRLSGSAAAVGTSVAMEQIEGGNELRDACMVMGSLARPATFATDAGRNLFRKQQEIRAAERRIKKVNSAKKVGKKGIQHVSKETEKALVKEGIKTTAKVAGQTAATTAGTAAAGPGGTVVGIAAGEAAGIEMDKRNVKNSTRNRMIRLFVAKLRQEENQDNIVKALKDVAMMRFSIAVKYVVKYTATLLVGSFFMMALVALPAIAMITVIYNSPFAIFLPSISSAETTQEVLTAYVAEFDREVEKELKKPGHYDKSRRVYVDYGGESIPDNYCDILAVYMVKYGDGDTATDMTDKAKENLKTVFDDMCSYCVTYGTESEEDEDGETVYYTVKYVEITLKTYQDMISVYGFNDEQQAILAEIMKPENLAMLGYSGSGGGVTVDDEQYQAIVDAVSDANGKKVVEFVLSKVGYPYSQALRNSGTHFDCSSLAYYAWRSAGVNISYHGSTTASAEAQYCYENNLLVQYGDMRPGDLIFYSYEKNGRFMNISHVAVYVGNGMVVEAANTNLGVVYRAIQGKNSIVMIGRPR